MTAHSTPSLADLDENGPDWLRSGGSAWRREVAAYVRTLGAMVRGPRKFGRDWAQGRFQAMNPLGFFGTTIAIAHLLYRALPALFGLGLPPGSRKYEGPKLWLEALQWVRPYVCLVLVGVLAHVALRAFRSRQRLSTTLGLTLFFSAVPLALEMAIAFARGPHERPTGHLELAYVGALMPFALALEGAHRRHWTLCLGIVLASAVVVTRVLDVAYDLLPF